MNATGLQNTSKCSGCHDGTNLGTIEDVIDEIQADTHDKWNATNATVISALNNINAYTGLKNLSRDRIAEAYWKLRLVSSDESWGVHNPEGTEKLLDDAAALAISANASLGLATSNVDLVTGWNLVSLNGTPAVTAPVSVLSSVSSNVTVAWGYNSTSRAWNCTIRQCRMPSIR